MYNRHFYQTVISRLWAEKIIEKLNKGADFAKLAKQHSICPSGKRGGDLGEFRKGQMVKAFDDVVFKKPLLKIHGPVKTKFGFHIIKTLYRDWAQPLYLSLSILIRVLYFYTAFAVFWLSSDVNTQPQQSWCLAISAHSTAVSRTSGLFSRATRLFTPRLPYLAHPMSIANALGVTWEQ